MAIIYSDTSKEIHIFNDQISYIIQILDNGELGNLYYGKKINHKEDFSYLLEGGLRSLAVYTKDNDYFMSPQYTKMEYPCSGTGDFREPAFEIKQINGSRVVCLEYAGHEIYKGKKQLEGLPATYAEEPEEADTIEILLTDELLQLDCILSYTVFRDYPVIARNVRFLNRGEEPVVLERVLSASVDLPDANYEMVSLAGAWARERHVKVRKIGQGVQGTGSRRGCSSAEYNPFLALKRPNTTENAGEALGFSLVYSGNHLELADVDTCDMTRVQIGIHPEGFEWTLDSNESFQSPEAILVYSDQGLNGMSQAYHKLYQTRLVRGYWRDIPRPILINNWEVTGADFTEESVLGIAKAGKELGIELFVLDDGWFGSRDDDVSGLGDWYVKNYKKLPNGIEGLADKVKALGMKFGLWFEPEMVNKDSDLYRKHPDWILCAPGRSPSPSRNQYVLDFSRQEVVDYIYNMMEKVLGSAEISYVKWDMNRYITECYSNRQTPQGQGKVMHQYILGVYQLYERLIARFPYILFESCASGGARFDPGMLYYAPQTWTSDDTDAMERVKIQYGTSYVYPVSAMGAHVSEVPNQQVGRSTPLSTRANAAMFGIFGYEMDLNKLTPEEKELVKQQITFVKEHRKLVMQGSFYRLSSPFEDNDGAWMLVSEDKKEALVGYYRMSGVPNGPWKRLCLIGLDKDRKYTINKNKEGLYGGDELMNAGMVIKNSSLCACGGDYSSGVYYIADHKSKDEGGLQG
ncbi:alpha-galactosidase [Lactonifactor longoviformis]|uniref:Alpha-galactosidase n=1 Tax=Lactonifactor longoviformis DSM 17459 TaxID=1122155 RepID=A0A1M4Y6B9_9CLOT|nr:alpha-galactosidase [Lactonifactor longoviformis]POP34996.1 alpha-galactosidase [Lactonifactor longoviformis]SHF01002.1 alpha-galactosidase [Lactonifactor longoviformis DSM 17459]